jgi:hypothetical protein
VSWKGEYNAVGELVKETYYDAEGHEVDMNE